MLDPALIDILYAQMRMRADTTNLNNVSQHVEVHWESGEKSIGFSTCVPDTLPACFYDHGIAVHEGWTTLSRKGFRELLEEMAPDFEPECSEGVVRIYESYHANPPKYLTSVVDAERVIMMVSASFIVVVTHEPYKERC